MSTSSEVEGSIRNALHRSRMDAMYKDQRHFYDVTRAYYLLGLDGLIEAIEPQSGARVLEIGCGTGRNIVQAARRYPEARFFGADISDEMLKSATSAVYREALVKRVSLSQADAVDLDPIRTFGEPSFERIYISYTLSMIPDWRGAVSRALQLLAPGGELHILDFGQSENLPVLFRMLLRHWLTVFDVEPRKELASEVSRMASMTGGRTEFKALYRGYAWSIKVSTASQR